MDSPQVIWLIGLFFASITANIGLLKIISDDKIDKPNTVALILNAVLSIVGGWFILVLLDTLYISIIYISFNIITFLILVYITRNRTIRALTLGENLLTTFKTIDLQISYILSEIIENKGSPDLTKPIRLAFRYILSEIPSFLGLDDAHRPQLGILIPEKNKFKFIAYSGIENYRIAKMEEMFQYGSNVVSLAGHAMNQRRPFVINDLSDKTNSDLEYWTKTSHYEEKIGSLLAYPILRGLGPTDSEPIAILYITSIKKNAFNNEVVINILSYFALKIEILQNCLEIASKK